MGLAMLWFALHLPALSLEACAAALPPPARQQQQRPLALQEAQRIAAVDAAAAAAGVQPGMTRATALALAPALCLVQADARRDAQALQAVAHAALAFTPAVALEGRATVLLEVASTLRCFGGADALLARLRRVLVPLGHRVQIAAAPTALGAALLARWRDDFERTPGGGPQRHDLTALQGLLDQAPLGLLEAAAPHGQALQGMGLRCLADLLRLPRAGLTRRFGSALLDELDRARGTCPDPRSWLCVPEHFSARLELAMRADCAEQLLHAAAMLLARLAAWAQARQARVQAFVLEMRHEARHRSDAATPGVTRLRIELAEPAADAGQLQALLRERLARTQLAAPTLELQLHCDEWLRQPAPNAELFPTRQSEHAGLVRLLERLQARLGEAQVLQLQTVADHRPERACVAVPLGCAAPAAAAVAVRPAPVVRAAAAPPPWPRPVWLLAAALPLADHRALPWFEGRPLQLLTGPERIEAGWWDGSLATRDYFIAQAGDGSLLWIYRARLPVADPTQPLWFLQGRFG